MHLEEGSFTWVAHATMSQKISSVGSTVGHEGMGHSARAGKTRWAMLNKP